MSQDAGHLKHECNNALANILLSIELLESESLNSTNEAIFKILTANTLRLKDLVASIDTENKKEEKYIEKPSV